MTYQDASRSQSTFQALADPTRRAILESLGRTPAPVGELARNFPISRPAISQHLKLLHEAGLVMAESEGTRRIYRLSPRGFEDLRDYLDRLWDDALASFADAARKEANRKKERTRNGK